MKNFNDLHGFPRQMELLEVEQTVSWKKKMSSKKIGRTLQGGTAVS